MMFKCFIPGRPIVKKNTQRVVGVGRSKRVIYSPKFLAWEQQALFSIKQAHTNKFIFSEEISAEYTFIFKNKQGEADVSNLVEGVSDALQKAGVIVDDKQIVKLTAYKQFSEDQEPGTHLVIKDWEG